MSKFLYIFNYEPREESLCQMEFQQIFQEPMTSKYYFSDQDFQYQRSVYIRGKLEMISQSSSFDEVIEDIKRKELCYYDFKVIYLKNDITHVPYQESIERCKDAALPIQGSVDLHHPQTIFAITKIEHMWYFGIYHEKRTWFQRTEKPYNYSHSLNIRDARTLVNIAVGNDENIRLVDPCCGIGTVVLEALSMGLYVKGYDINEEVAYQASLNLEHFGYDPNIIETKDMHDIHQTFDVAIMDIPYGVYSPFTHQQQISLLKQAKKIAKKLLLVSHIDMNEDLIQLNYSIIDQCTIKKANFIRYITLCKRKEK